METGEKVHASCKRYDCAYCGPRRIAMWRDLIELAAPERFATLSRCGSTLVEASRTVTTVVQRLRRHGYRIQFLVTYEQHRNGFWHAHMLLKGDFIPQAFLSDCLRSATGGASFICDIRRVRDVAAIGYVTKYITKQLGSGEIGRREDGTAARVRRVRYSKAFFPASTSALQEYLAAQAREERGQAEPPEGAWVLVEEHPLPRDDEGRVDQERAAAQYVQLVEAAVIDKGTQVRLVRGSLLVLRYMEASDIQVGSPWPSSAGRPGRSAAAERMRSS